MVWSAGGWTGAGLEGVTLESGRGLGGVGRGLSISASATLPDFHCLVDAARHHVGGALVEICRTERRFTGHDHKQHLYMLHNRHGPLDHRPGGRCEACGVRPGARAVLTQRGNKVFMGTQGLHTALVLVVPDSQGFVISTAHDEPAARVHHNSPHPVVMADLGQTGEYRGSVLKSSIQRNSVLCVKELYPEEQCPVC